MTETAAPRWAQKKRRPVLGVVLIVKNEVEHLPRLFESIRDLADEVVVGDTGSTDGTLALCKAWGVKVLQIAWRDDFSHARNRVLQAATAPSLLRLDADEEVPAATAVEIARLRDVELTQRPRRAYNFQVRNRVASGMTNHRTETRIFPNHPKIRYAGAIHEEIITSLRAAGIAPVDTGLEILHMGYEDRTTVRKKAERNEPLLRAALANDPSSAHLLLHLAQTQAATGAFAPAIETLSEALEALLAGPSPDSVLLAEVHTLRALYQHEMRDYGRAHHDLDRARVLHPAWALPVAIQAEYHAENGEWDALPALLEEAHRRSFSVGTIDFPLTRAQSNLHLFAGLLAERAGERKSARPHYQAALDLDAANLNARLSFGQLLLDAGEGAAAREVLEPAGEDEGAIPRFVEVASAIALARFLTGDAAGAAACLSPLLDVFAAPLHHARDVGPAELAEVMLQAGYGQAAKNMLALLEHAALAA